MKLQNGRVVQTWLREVPSAPQLMLVHGNPGSLLDWAPLVGPLGAFAEVAAIDVPGFGRSPRPVGDATSVGLDRLADDVVATAGALGWQAPFFVVGHSHGGGVAQTVAARHSDRVAGIVALGSLGGIRHASYRLLSSPGVSTVIGTAATLFRFRRMDPVTRRILGVFMRTAYAPEIASASSVDALLVYLTERPEMLQSMVDVTLGRPWDQLLASASRIRCPVLFMHGQQDALVPASCAKAIHDAILEGGGRSEFRLIDGAGHMLPEFQVSEVAAEIARFVGTP